MLKTVLLLTFAVFVSSATTNPRHIHNTLLGELIDELNTAMKDFPNGVKEIFLKDLDETCNSQEEREVYFCQAEQELLKKVSGLSGAKFDHFRTDKKLMRNLNKYNKLHGKTCKPDSEVQVAIPLHAFLKNLLRCVKNAYSKAK